MFLLLLYWSFAFKRLTKLLNEQKSLTKIDEARLARIWSRLFFRNMHKQSTLQETKPNPN